jgi:hypothetical protein
MASLPQGMAKGGDRVEMAAGGGAEQAVVGHGVGRRIEIFRLLWERSRWAARRNLLQ